MSWLNLNQSLNSLKGQITSFASEVLSENPQHEAGEGLAPEGPPLTDLEVKCKNQELEIAALKKLTEELEASLLAEKLAKKNGVKEDESTWYWDPPPDPSRSRPPDLDMEDQYRATIRALQDELASLKDTDNYNRPYNEEELLRLKEENKNLTTNLEDLDSQHQMAMERLLMLKTELQKNFEILRQEHEDLKNTNDNNSFENKELLIKLEEKEKDIEASRSEYDTLHHKYQNLERVYSLLRENAEKFQEDNQEVLIKIEEKDKEIEALKSVKSEYDTLHHKYQNLERVYSMLRENAEKFQEENQELHEEVFKLQEQVTKLEHDIEVVLNKSESSNVVSKEKYEKLVQELNDLKITRNINPIHTDEVNIDDNAKSVIENLKRDINELRHRLSQKDEMSQDNHHQMIKADKIMQLYNKYVNFELPIDFVGEIPTSGDIVLYKLESVFKTVNSFKKEIDTLEHQISEKNLNMNHLQTQIDDITSENDFLTTDIQHFESELSEMKKNNDFLINEIAALKSTSKLQPIIETHEDNLNKLETELADCNKQNKTFESEIKRIEYELSEVRDEKDSLQASLTDLKEKYTLMLKELEMFKTQTKAVEDLESDTNFESAEKHKKSLQEIDDLKKRLNNAAAKNEQMSIDLHIIENDKVLLTKEVDDLKHTVEEKVATNKEFESLSTNLRNQLNESEAKIEDLMKKNLDIENVKAQLQVQISKVEQELCSRNTNKSKPEMEKLLTEKLLLSERLEQSIGENATLKEKLEKLTNEFLQLLTRENQLICEIDSLKHKNSTEEDLHETINDLKRQLQNQHELKAEVMRLKEEIKEHIEKKVLLEAELSSTDVKIVHLEQEFEKLFAEVSEKDSIIDTLNSNVTQSNTTISNLNQNVGDLETSLKIKNEEIQKLRNELSSIAQNLNQSLSSKQELDKLSILKEENEKQLTILNEDLNNKNFEISKLQNLLDEHNQTCNEHKLAIDSKDKEIKELKQSIVELSDKMKVEDVHQTNEINKTSEIEELRSNLTVSEQKVSELMLKNQQLENTCKDHETALNTSNKEKTELITLVNMKHNESLQYHNEIQRLNHILLEQASEFKRIIDENEKNIQNTQNNCTECEKLRMIIKEKDSQMNRNESNSDIEKMKHDLLNASETVKHLTEKIDSLEKNLAIQLDNIKRLTAENLQLTDKEQSSIKELERLRHHLMETQESHTRELMTSEQKLTECQTALHRIEERAKHTTTVYTSNSIRANQEVETLRNQIKLLEKQREEAQGKLGEAEDGRSRSEAALTNLQVVLEQFQLDKEREIHAATEKIRNKMEDLKLHNHELREEISRLNKKLEESIAGLRAATRLGDQVETKTAQINDLKEQVKTLQTSVSAAEERYYNAISNQQDKVDKNLVKNLVINYVVTAGGNHTNKTQVLRVLSTVLDFNQQECEKLGLSRPPSDSLAAEFVKFLQNESRPRLLPNIMTLNNTSSATTPQSSRRSSTMGPSPYEEGHKRNPSTGSNNLLFQNIDKVETSSQLSIESERPHTLDTGVNQTRNTEGAILKHVLKDM